MNFDLGGMCLGFSFMGVPVRNCARPGYWL